LKTLLVVGARPNFMKAAPILAALQRAGHEAVLVHTGQHYDIPLSDVFFRDLDLPAPDFHLGVGSGTHAEQTARTMEAFEPVLVRARPDVVVVVGDVNATLACAVVTAKLRFELGCPLAHVEAGLRSNDRNMPEEVNRLVTDRLADLLLTPSADATFNLRHEGIEQDRIVMVGNVMIDVLLARLEQARARALPARLGLAPGGYAVATLHRPSNVDDRVGLGTLLEILNRIAERMPVVFPVHPRTRRNAEQFGLTGGLARLRTLEPQGYLDMLSLVDGAAVCLTDSGGLQAETTALGVPCVTLREQTEWVVTLTQGTNRLAPWPLTVAGVLAAFERAAGQGRTDVGSKSPEGWDGHAAERVTAALERHLRAGGLRLDPL